jgi:hypothetical protein
MVAMWAARWPYEGVEMKVDSKASRMAVRRAWSRAAMRDVLRVQKKDALFVLKAEMWAPSSAASGRGRDVGCIEGRDVGCIEGCVEGLL